MTASRSELEVLYREEESPDVKERLLLVLRVEGDGMVPARVAKELHRSRPWTSFWLERYQEEGVLFLDKATQHQTEEVLSYFERHERTLVPVWEPRASPEFMPLEECWNVSKDDLLVLRYYSSFPDFKEKIGEYFRTKRFHLDVANYLTAEPR